VQVGPEPFGRALRRLRERAGLSQEELAARAGLSVRAISALERGDRLRPYPHTVRVLASALGLAGEDRALLETGRPARGRRPRPPGSPSTLIGRQVAIESVAGLITAGSRLVTLTGPGGVGKTRLALAVGERLAERFTDGVAFVSLASVPDPELVLEATARALEMRVPGGGAVQEALHAYLRSRNVLLLLDNFEHLVGAAPQVAELLAAAPRLRVLATTRAPLRLGGEHVYPVPPLAPEAAAELFEQRSRQAAGQPAADPEIVTEICWRLDGLPLAIELAAARTRVRPPAALLNRLDRPLAVLTGGARDLPPRQQTISRTVAWSHDLLRDPEKALFRRLSVFAGSWPLNDAAAMCGVGDMEALEVHEALLDGSLIASQPGAGAPRFRMLSTIGAYAAELLEASGEAERFRDRHATHYLGLALEGGRAMWAATQPEWLDRLDLDNDNLQLAFRRRLDRGDLDSIVAACYALWVYWWIRGYLRQGRRWTDLPLASAGALSPAARAKLLFTGAFVRMPRGGNREAAAMLEEADPLARLSGDRVLLAWVLINRAMTSVFEGRFGTAAAQLDEAEAVSREVADVDAQAWAGLVRAHFAVQQGRFDDADRALTESLREVGDRAAPWSIGTLLNVQGRVVLWLGDTARAEPLLRRSAQLLGRLRDRGAMGFTLAFLAVAAALRSEGERAAQLFGASDSLMELSGAVHQGRYQELVERGRMTARSQLGSATYGSLHRQGQTLTFEDVIALATGNRIQRA
jgi:predicted ATPase/DNA-binding XRE family transcriptional regulator